MSRALPKYNKRRVAVIGGAAAVALSGAVIAGTALAGTPAKSGGAAQARTLASPGTISCPDVAAKLPAVPASAQAEVDRNLALLQTQIQEADKRLQTTVGQGGPNFVNNAILGPLKDKRTSTIDRIAIAIGRTTTKPTGLDSLAACTLNASGTSTAGGGAGAPSTAATRQSGTGTSTAAGGAGAGTISCPDVAAKLPAVPTSAQAEVDRNLALLQTQIQEADKRLQTAVGQGGPNFVNNAILGPLKDKRTSTIDRIAIAIGRTTTKPTGLDSLAACTLTK
jgi:F0F1-type ATP synthase membrane subunit b/b'